MDPGVGHLHCRYLSPGGPIAPALRSRLDRVARDAVTRALESVPGPSVCVLRELTVRHAFEVDSLSDDALAETWGRDLAAAIADADNGTAEVVRFGDTAEFVARFLSDLADGVAWDRWWFDGFAPLRSADADTARAVLTAHRPIAGPVLARLHRAGTLGRVLGLFDEPARVWELLLPIREQACEENALAAVAAELARALGLGKASAAMAPVSPRDWSDPRDLAEGVWEALAPLVATAGPTPDESRVAAALRGLDWLDTDILRERLLSGPAAAARVTARPPVPTPRRTELAEALADIVREGQLPLDPVHPQAPGNAVTLYAALADRLPSLAAAPAALGMVERALTDWGRRSRPESGPAFPVEEFASAPDGPSGIHSPCAGVALLLRGLTSLRLPALAERSGSPALPGASPAAMLLLALGLRWAGPESTDHGRIDPGLALLTGADDSLGRADLGRAWAGLDEEHFASVWLTALLRPASQVDTLHVYALPTGRHGRLALVAAMADGSCLAGCIIRRPTDVSAVLEGWLDTWEAVTGRRPTGVVCDPVLLDAPGPPGARVLAATDEHRAGRAALLRTLNALGPGRLGRPGTDLLLGLVAACLLRRWAAWLRGFSGASAPYLLQEFVRRPGIVAKDGDVVRVQLEPRPRDLVLELAGYLAEAVDDPSARPPFVAVTLRRQ